MILVSKFTFHYVSISTSVNPKIRTYEWLFTFHYVSISTLIVQVLFVLIVCIYIPLCIYFNFFAAAINVDNCSNLHSTMYLFQPNYDDIDLLNNIIYIPLCIYFNMYMSPLLPEYLYIYIPLCIYFNQSKIKEQNLFQTHLHSTMYLFQR